MDEVLEKINELYGLKLELLEKVTRGFLSENHVLIDKLIGKKYFLKRYRFDNKEKIEQIHIAKKYFFEKGIPVIMPFVSNKEETFFNYKEVYFSLFPFIEARHVERSELSDEAIISLGQMLAKIHLAGKDAPVLIQERFGGWNKDKLLERIAELKSVIGNIESIDEFDAQALLDIELRESIIISNTTTFEDLDLQSDHLIHGDYHGGNVFFDEQAHVSHVFDFEKSLFAPRMFELFRSTVFIFFGDTFSEESISKARLYIKAYTEVYPASKEELHKGITLFYLRFVHGLWVQTEHYLKGNTRVDQFLSQDYERIKYLSENLNSLADKLIN